MRRVVKVAGTHDWNPTELSHDRWWQSDSRFTEKLAKCGFDHVGWDVSGQEIPQWSCALSGTFFAGRDLRTWWRGGFSLAAQLLKLPTDERNVIAHSHGGNVAVLALMILASHNEQVSCLITVCAPVRRDMTVHYKAVTCPWRHIYSKQVWGNRMQWMGSRVRMAWKMPGDVVDNYEADGICHSDLVRDPDRCEHVFDDGIVSFLEQQGPHGPDGDSRDWGLM
jgi:hypothetical protein